MVIVLLRIKVILLALAMSVSVQITILENCVNLRTVETPTNPAQPTTKEVAVNSRTSAICIQLCQLAMVQIIVIVIVGKAGME